MSADNTSLVLGGRPITERLAAAMPGLARDVVAVLRDRIAVYASLPREQLDGDIARVVERALRMFGQVLATHSQPTDHELAGVRESAARRAEEGVPIDAVLTAYHLGASICADQLQSEAGPEDVSDLLAIQRLTLGFLQRVTAAVAAGYFEERRTMFGDEHSARQSLLAALLDGQQAESAAERAGIRLPPGYLVLYLAICGHADESDHRVDASIVIRRRLRRLRVELEHQAADPVLSMLSADGGVVLIPLAVAPSQLSTMDWKRFGDLLERLRVIGGTAVTAGAVATVPAGVAGSAELAREVLSVARTFGRPPGLYQLGDLLLEYQLTLPSPARRELARLLDPIGRDNDLLTTLRTYVDSGLNRQRAARLLHIHPNTVDYRLRKIAGLTGLDATRAGDLPRIAAALAARDAHSGLLPPPTR